MRKNCALRWVGNFPRAGVGLSGPVRTGGIEGGEGAGCRTLTWPGKGDKIDGAERKDERFKRVDGQSAAAKRSIEFGDTN